jgi:hypothetical protein
LDLLLEARTREEFPIPPNRPTLPFEQVDKGLDAMPVFGRVRNEDIDH